MHEKKRLRHVKDLNRAITCRRKKKKRRFGQQKKAPAALKKGSPGYHSEMDLAIFVIGHTHIQFELAMPSQNHNIARYPAVLHDVIHGL